MGVFWALRFGSEAWTRAPCPGLSVPHLLCHIHTPPAPSKHRWGTVFSNGMSVIGTDPFALNLWKAPVSQKMKGDHGPLEAQLASYVRMEQVL